MKSINVFLLFKSQVQDIVFIKEFAQGFRKVKNSSLVLHEGTNPEDSAGTAFLTKRICGFLSEEMVTACGFSGSHRNILQEQGNRLRFRSELAGEWFEQSRVIVLNSLCIDRKNGERSFALSDLFPAVLAEYKNFCVILFPDNPNSPFVQQAPVPLTAENTGKFHAEEGNETAVSKSIQQLFFWVAKSGEERRVSAYLCSVRNFHTVPAVS